MHSFLRTVLANERLQQQDRKTPVSNTEEVKGSRMIIKGDSETSQHG